MEQVKVKIKGTAALLMQRYVIEDVNNTKAKRKDEKHDPTEDANKYLYKDSKIGCYVPSSWIESCIRDVSKEFKGRGKGSLKSAVLSSVFVNEEKIPLNKDTYDEIDLRPVVIQRNRIVKARPKFNNWELSFTINFNPDRLKKEVLKQMLEEAGLSVGIGDYRPKFGRFELILFK